MTDTYDSNKPYDQPSTIIPSSTDQRPSLRQRQSIMDELIPLPSSSSGSIKKDNIFIPINVLRRTGSVTIITVFLLATVFLATTEPQHRQTGLRVIFGVGSDVGIGGAGWVAEDLTEATGGQADTEKSIGWFFFGCVDE